MMASIQKNVTRICKLYWKLKAVQHNYVGPDKSENYNKEGQIREYW